MKVQTNEIGELYLLIWAYTAGIKSIEKPLRRIHIVRTAGWGSAKIVLNNLGYVVTMVSYCVHGGVEPYSLSNVIYESLLCTMISHNPVLVFTEDELCSCHSFFYVRSHDR